MSSLDGVVGTLRRSDARSRALPYLIHAALGAAVWVAIVLLAARIVPLETRLQPAALGISVILVAVGIAWLVIRPRPDALMQRADLRLGLQERLSTAWERRGANGVMDDLLRQDALLHAERDRLKKAFPVRINRREAAAVAIVAATALALFVLPNPMDQVLSQRQADRASQAKAASTIRDVQKKIAASTKTAPVAPQVQQILSDTQKKIAQALDPRQALAPISPAEQQLQQLSDPQTAARTSSAQNLANSLSTTTSGQAAGQALSNSPSQGAKALRDLAAQLQSLTPEQRAQLAKALANAAQHAQDPAMAATLQRASGALSTGDIASAAGALSDLATQMDSLQDQQNNDQAIAAAINGLEAARQGLAAQANRDAAGGAPAAAASPAASAAASARNGNGNGNGNGSATGTGSGSGSGNGNGGTGGPGGSGSGSGSGSGAKPGEQLYVPGQPIPGQVVSDPAPLGPGQDVPLTPYTQVVQAYRQAALDATAQSLIPGSESDLVREYFSRLGETAVAP